MNSLDKSEYTMNSSSGMFLISKSLVSLNKIRVVSVSTTSVMYFKFFSSMPDIFQLAIGLSRSLDDSLKNSGVN